MPSGKKCRLSGVGSAHDCLFTGRRDVLAVLAMHLDMTSCRAHIGVHTLRFIFVNDHATSEGNKYVGPYCRAKMYARRVACCPLVSGESRRVRAKRAIKIRKIRDRQRDRQTDRRTPDRYITLTARRGQRNESKIPIYFRILSNSHS